MAVTRRPHTLSLSHRGTITGLTISTKGPGHDLCHYYGNIRYALPPPQRWRRARKLPADYTYGTADTPGRCDGGAGLCPQPGFMSLSPVNEDAWSEDCFQANVWVPLGVAPGGGWPVMVYFHGGWLQFGTPNTFNAAALLGETTFKAIIVMPAYRVNLFGFLYSAELEADAASVGETTGNHGFWDQRLAIEWTRENIHLFGGNPDNITICGYSAGGNSVFNQLAYDLRQSDEKALIRQACIWSNSPAVQPKSPGETQIQFDQLLDALGIPLRISASEKLARLRALPAKILLDAVKTIEIHQFRPTTDGVFIQPSLFASLDNGTFARKLLSRNIRLILGECADERFLYSIWHPPTSNTLSALRTRLIADYPVSTVDTLISLRYPDGHLPPGVSNWHEDEWGRVYADMQVHHMQRGLVWSLTGGNSAGVDASHLVFRYRIEWRAGCVEGKGIPVEWGVTHSSDYAIWFWGNGDVLSEREKGVVEGGFVGPLGKFVKGTAVDAGGGDGFGWGVCGREGVRTLKSDGSVVIERDEMWEEGVRVWKRLRGAAERSKARL